MKLLMNFNLNDINYKQNLWRRILQKIHLYFKPIQETLGAATSVLKFDLANL